MLFATKWPTDIWAVEYTTISDQRTVAVMESLDAAQLFIEKANRNYWANPVLLHSQANFFPARPIAYGPGYTADVPKHVGGQWLPCDSANAIEREYAHH